MTWYVHRRDDGSIASAHRRRRPGYAEEALADDDAEIVALHAPIEQAKQRRAAAFSALEQRGNGPPSREEFEALKVAVRELVS